jgi:ketosteroid isomerase-like protein
MLPKDQVIAFLQAFWAAEEAAWEKHLAPDARFLFAPSLPYAREGSRGRDWDARVALRRIVDDLFSVFAPPGLHVELTSAFAEGNEVAVEYTARGRTLNGKTYENYYLMRASVRDGLIVRLVPYNDTRQLELLMGLG